MLRPGKAHPLPGAAGVAAAVDPVPPADMAPADVLPGADPDHVGVFGVESDLADRVGGLVLENGRPGGAGVGGLPDPARAGGHVPGARNGGMDRDIGDAAAHQAGADAAQRQRGGGLGQRGFGGLGGLGVGGLGGEGGSEDDGDGDGEEGAAHSFDSWRGGGDKSRSLSGRKPERTTRTPGTPRTRRQRTGSAVFVVLVVLSAAQAPSLDLHLPGWHGTCLTFPSRPSGCLGGVRERLSTREAHECQAGLD